MLFSKPPRGTVLLGGFELLLKMQKFSIYAALSHIKPTIGTVPLGGLNSCFHTVLSYFIV